MGAVSTEYAEPHEYSAEDRLAYASHQMYAIGQAALDKSIEISNSTAEAEVKDRAMALAKTVLDSMHSSYQLFEEVVRMQTAPTPEYEDNLFQFPDKHERPPQPQPPEYPPLGLEVDGQSIDDSHLAFVGPNERFILEYLSLSQKDIFTRKDVIKAGFYPKGATASAKHHAFKKAVANLCEKLRKEDTEPVIEARGIKRGRKYVLNSTIILKAEPVFVTSLPEVEKEISKKEKAATQPKRKRSMTKTSKAKAKAKPKTKQSKATKPKPAHVPKKVYESTMTSAEFWKSPIPKEKPRMNFRGAGMGPKENRAVPEPVGTATEMVDGKEYKVTILPGFTGRPAPLPEKLVQVGSHQLTSDGRIVNLKKSADY